VVTSEGLRRRLAWTSAGASPLKKGLWVQRAVANGRDLWLGPAK
jgi:hypothetical protein